jgi:DNA repair exonuclease SbcCD ATPase subunit
MIEFIHLSIRHFRSWKRLDIDLSEQGVSCIKGQTGAGKSSIFSALFWGLYGRLPEDVKADEVRGSRKPTAVRIILRRENQQYVITRYRGHMEYKSKVFFKGPGIPLVVEDSYVRTVQGFITAFLGVNETIFLTTTYFAQRNFHHFHTLTDTHKKAFIESITYGSLFEACERLSKEQANTHQKRITFLEGQLYGLQESIKNIQSHSKEQKQQLKKDIRDARTKIESINEHLYRLEINLESYSRFVDEYNKLNDHIWTNDSKISSIQEDIERYRNNTGPCPRCGLTMLDNLKKGRILEAETSIQKLQIHSNRLRERFKKVQAGYKKYKTTETWIDEKEHDKRNLQIQLKSIKHQLQHKDNSQELLKECETITEEINILKRELQYISFWVKGFSFTGLRAYILTNAIKYLSQQIEMYLRRVMGEKIDFELRLENNRLITECNERSYGTLSGGERQAVDLCTGLAMRDLAEQYNKSNFNLLVLDEPHEGMDKNLTAIAQSLLLEYAKPSTFLITHQGYSGNFDRLYNIRKDKGHSIIEKVY